MTNLFIKERFMFSFVFKYFWQLFIMTNISCFLIFCLTNSSLNIYWLTERTDWGNKIYRRFADCFRKKFNLNFQLLAIFNWLLASWKNLKMSIKVLFRESFTKRPKNCWILVRRSSGWKILVWELLGQRS